jgi:cyanophycinase
MDGRLLFLLGGSQGGILDAVAGEFVLAAGGRDAAIALLIVGGEGWESAVPQYTDPWGRLGATRHHVIVPGGDGVLDVDATVHYLRNAGGIFIGGGRTPRYLELYASEPIKSVVRERYDLGVPFAGLSAGARMAPDRCCLFPTPKAPNQPSGVYPGLGLVSDLIVEVHFDENPSGLKWLLESMALTRTRRGLGIAASACAVLRNGQLERVLGPAVSQVVMADFDSRRYEIAEAGPTS